MMDSTLALSRNEIRDQGSMMWSELGLGGAPRSQSRPAQSKQIEERCMVGRESTRASHAKWYDRANTAANHGMELETQGQGAISFRKFTLVMGPRVGARVLFGSKFIVPSLTSVKSFI